MIKYFCDRVGCGKEIADKSRIIFTDLHWQGFVIGRCGPMKSICEKCSDKLDAIKDQIEDEQDFLQMTDEDIELFRYTFKVGDKVITSDGRTGTITSICDCDRCKNRGFYEPKVEMNIGVDQIWITDTDKENGFISFYQIGDRVFGNVDTEASKYIRERIIELKHEVINYESQLNMMKKLENNNGN